VKKELNSGKIIQRRNHAIHGNRWLIPNDPASELIIVHRGKNAGKPIKRSDNELAQLGKDIAKIHKQLFKTLKSANLLH